MGSHITTDTRSIKTCQLNLKYKVVAAILNYIMKIFAISSLILLIVAIAIIGKATGQRSTFPVNLVSFCPQFREWVMTIVSCNDSNDVEACCKEHGVPEECLKYC